MVVIHRLTAPQIEQLHRLYQQTWWANARTLEQTQRVVAGSPITVGLLDEQQQLRGFARVLTDFVFKALIFDVIVDAPVRGLGYGDELIRQIKNHPDLADVQHLELYCLPEMFAFYQRYGFSTDLGEVRLMRVTG